MSDAPAEGERDGEAAPPALSGPVRRFLVARYCSMAVIQIQAVAVGWYVYALTSSAMDLGFIGLAQFLPTASLALVAGQVIDRYPRRLVLLSGLAIEALCALSLGLLALSGAHRVDLIFVIIACFGAARAFETTAMSSLLPGLVSAKGFPRAAATSSLAGQCAVITGPTIGGLLYLVGTPAPFFAAAALTTVGFLSILSLSPATTAKPGSAISWRGIMGGIQFLRRTEPLRGALTLDLFGVLFGGATALLPIFARDILVIGPVGLGLLRSAPALGGMTMGLILSRRPMTRHTGRRMFIGVAVYGVATVVFGLSRWLPLSFVALVTIGAADMVSIIVRTTLVQTATPDSIRGRVNAINTIFLGTANQLGEFESGVTAAWFGAVGSVVLGGLVTIGVVTVCSRVFPQLRRMDRFLVAPPETA